MEILELWQIQSVNAVVGQNANNLLFLYIILCCIIKRSVFLLAFLLPELLINLSMFDSLSEWHIAAIEVIIFSYVFDVCDNSKSKAGCCLVITQAIIIMFDSYFYGAGGAHGEHKTIVYNNIESISLCVHVFFILTLIPFKRIRDDTYNFIDSVMRISLNSDYMLLFWYNRHK